MVQLTNSRFVLNPSDVKLKAHELETKFSENLIEM
jgi:hypothetical protein